MDERLCQYYMISLVSAMSALDRATWEVLRHYPLPSLTPVALGNRGGFSGARLWRVTGAGGDFCLRAWPVEMTRERLTDIHRLMGAARQAGLSFIPALLPTASGATWRAHAGRLWEVADWMPGAADFHAQPSLPRLEAACSALALLHDAWTDTLSAPCPAIRRRLDAAFDWIHLLDSGWQPAWPGTNADPVEPWAERAWRLVQRHIRNVPDKLAGWSAQPFSLQPCLCDVWHDHVLFTGDLVTGVIDFGGVKPDSVTVDLARLLGSLIADDAGRRAAGLRAYARVRPLTPAEEALVPLLDETGTVIGLANWLKWLYRDGKRFDDPAAVARRLAELVQRVERWDADR